MFRRFVTVCVLFGLVGAAAAAEIKGTIKSVDPAKSSLTITVGKEDKTIPVAKGATIIYGNTGKVVKGGLKGLTASMEVEATVEDGEAGNAITLIKVNKGKQ